MEKDGMTNEQQPGARNLCGGGCGFYGSPATDGLCSKCFKDSLKRKQDPNRLSPTSLSSAMSTAISEGMEKVVAASTSNVHPVVVRSPQFATSDKVPMESTAGGDEASPSSASSPAVDVSDEQAEAKPAKPKNRCHHCNKRVGLTGFPCRCDGVFCGEHRYSDAHSCSFDYKAFGAEQIRKNNPQIVGAKIDKL